MCNYKPRPPTHPHGVHRATFPLLTSTHSWAVKSREPQAGNHCHQLRVRHKLRYWLPLIFTGFAQVKIRTACNSEVSPFIAISHALHFCGNISVFTTVTDRQTLNSGTFKPSLCCCYKNCARIKTQKTAADARDQTTVQQCRQLTPLHTV